jgi:hypothetical protein
MLSSLVGKHESMFPTKLVFWPTKYKHYRISNWDWSSGYFKSLSNLVEFIAKDLKLEEKLDQFEGLFE